MQAGKEKGVWVNSIQGSQRLDTESVKLILRAPFACSYVAQNLSKMKALSKMASTFGCIFEVMWFPFKPQHPYCSKNIQSGKNEGIISIVQTLKVPKNLPRMMVALVVQTHKVTEQ